VLSLWVVGIRFGLWLGATESQKKLRFDILDCWLNLPTRLGAARLGDKSQH